MATFSRNLNDGYVFRLVTSMGAQSIAGNYSDVHWWLQIVKGNPNSWWYHLDGVAWSVREPDPTVAASGTRTPAYDFRDQNVTVWQIASGVRRVYHNADGTYSKIWAGHWAAQHTALGGGSVSGRVTLKTIPRATEPSWSGSFETGTSKKIDLPRASSGFTHDVTYSFGSKTGTITVGAGAYTHWIAPHSLLTEIPNNTSGTGTITVVTKSGSTVIGTKSKTFTLTANPSQVPTISQILWDDNNPVVKNNIGAFVEGESLIKGTITAAGVHGSTISSRRTTVGGTTVDQGGTVRAPKPGAGNTVAVAGEVTDSRSRKATLSQSITVLPYARPHIGSGGWQVRRANASNVPDENGEYLRVDLHAVASSLVVGSEKNALKIKILTRPALGGPWTTRNQITATLSHNAAIQVSGGAVFSTATSYEVRVELTDNVHTVAGPSDGVQTTVPTATVALDLHGTQVGVGKRWEQGALDVGGDIYAAGSLVLTRGDIGFIDIGTQDLNTFTTPGYRYQNLSANATLERNYPAWEAGALEVLPNVSRSFLIQRYTTYNSNQVFVRRLYQGSWSAWRLIYAPMPASQVVNYNDATTITAASGVWQNVPNLSAITFSNVPYPLEVKVTFGAVVTTTSGYSMMGVLTSGATSVSEQMLTNGAHDGGFGAHTPFTSGADIQMTGFKLITLNPGNTTFQLKSRRNVSSGVQGVNYPSMMVEPIQWRY